MQCTASQFFIYLEFSFGYLILKFYWAIKVVLCVNFNNIKGRQKSADFDPCDQKTQMKMFGAHVMMPKLRNNFAILHSS